MRRGSIESCNILPISTTCHWATGLRKADTCIGPKCSAASIMARKKETITQKNIFSTSWMSWSSKAMSFVTPTIDYPARHCAQSMYSSYTSCMSMGQIWAILPGGINPMLTTTSASSCCRSNTNDCVETTYSKKTTHNPSNQKKINMSQNIGSQPRYSEHDELDPML